MRPMGGGLADRIAESKPLPRPTKAFGLTAGVVNEEEAAEEEDA